MLQDASDAEPESGEDNHEKCAGALQQPDVYLRVETAGQKHEDDRDRRGFQVALRLHS